MLQGNGSTRPRLASRLLGAGPVAASARLLISGRLRVLAYHDVPDADTFAHHLDHIQEHYRPVSGEHVAAAAQQDTPLPRRAIWITFDDAGPGVFRNAMPLLVDRSVPATVFVCPGVIDTDRAYWWQIIAMALASGQPIEIDGAAWFDASAVTHLKRVPDSMRREVVARTMDVLADAGQPTETSQARSAQLRRWLDAGLGAGNHTWDHPCLDMCDEEQQRFQIVAAHDWLRQFIGAHPRLFAFPNGNVAGASRTTLSDLGYHVTALFDHRVARPSDPEISRLRVDADAPVDRLAGIASGAHPAAYAVVERLRRTHAPRYGNAHVV